MPVYEYECERCQLRFERLQKFGDSPLTECPDCGGLVHRVIQPVGVIFKGSGFYVTDNRGKSSTMPPTKREGDVKADSGERASEVSDGKQSSESTKTPESPST